MRRFLLTSALLFVLPAGSLAQNIADFVGTWRVADTRNFSSNAPFSTSARIGYTFTITRTATDLSVAFPKLPALLFHLDGTDHEYVQDNRDSWTKFRTSLRWDGATLVLKSTSWNGWWKDSRPENVTSQPTQLEETRTLTLTGRGLSMETTARDEKPFVPRYVDTLVRVPQ